MNRGDEKQAKKLALLHIAERRQQQKKSVQIKNPATIIALTDSDSDGDDEQNILAAGLYREAREGLTQELSKLTISTAQISQDDDRTRSSKNTDIPCIKQETDSNDRAEDVMQIKLEGSVQAAKMICEDESQCLVLGNSKEFKLSAQLSQKLYPHQIEGVKWLFGLFKVSSGGILADDMGLGKTMQVSALLSGLFHNNLITRAMVVAPKTLLAAWTKELAVCGMKDATYEYGGTQNERSACLSRVMKQGGILVTTYGMLLHNAESLVLQSASRCNADDEDCMWDLMVMDEGHKLKNPKTKLRTSIQTIQVTSKVLITGTPISNNLMEMHALFDLVCPGLLGSSKQFKDEFEKRITEGSHKDATVGERQRAAATATALRKKIAPFMLRREKKDVFAKKETPSSSTEPVPAAAAASFETTSNTTADDAETATVLPRKSAVHPISSVAVVAAIDSKASHRATLYTMSSDGTARPENNHYRRAAPTIPLSSSTTTLPRKNDFVVWLSLEQSQRRLYEAFLHSDSVRSVLNQTSSALASLTVLKKICDHPALLSEKAQGGILSGAERAARRARGEDSDGDESEEDDGKKEKEKNDQYLGHRSKGPLGHGTSEIYPDIPSMWKGTTIDKNILSEMHSSGLEASCKTSFVLSLLRNHVSHGHRTLVFSQSRVMLNILEAGIRSEGWKFCRIDGAVASANERQARVDTYQTDPSIPIFLLTSQVGGLGLTLTAADRVIIVDPAWNPTVDSQSVDRAYRIGQTRDVVVYRLISCGTVEDKIYRKQVFKGGLSRTSMEDGEQFRYFSVAELKDLFTLNPNEALQSSTQRQLHALHAHQRITTPELEHHIEFLEGLKGFAGVSDHDLLYSVKENSNHIDGDADFLTQVEQGAAINDSTMPRGGSGYKRNPTVIDTTATTSRRQHQHPRQQWTAGSTYASASHGSGDGISDMFARALTLDGRSATASSGLTGRNAHRYHAPNDPSNYNPVTLEIDSLKSQIAKQQRLLSDPFIVNGLPDKGDRLRATLRQLESKLHELTGPLGIGAAHMQQHSGLGATTLPMASSPPPPPAAKPPRLYIDASHANATDSVQHRHSEMMSPLRVAAMQSNTVKKMHAAEKPPERRVVGESNNRAPPSAHSMPSSSRVTQGIIGREPSAAMSPLGKGARDRSMDCARDRSMDSAQMTVKSAIGGGSGSGGGGVGFGANRMYTTQQQHHCEDGSRQHQESSSVAPTSPLKKLTSGLVGLFGGGKQKSSTSTGPLRESEATTRDGYIDVDKSESADDHEIDTLSYKDDCDYGMDSPTLCIPGDKDNEEKKESSFIHSNARASMDSYGQYSDISFPKLEEKKEIFLPSGDHNDIISRRELKRELYDRAKVLSQAEKDPYIDPQYVVQIREEVEQLAELYYAQNKEKNKDEYHHS